MHTAPSKTRLLAFSLGCPPLRWPLLRHSKAAQEPASSIPPARALHLPDSCRAWGLPLLQEVHSRGWKDIVLLNAAGLCRASRTRRNAASRAEDLRSATALPSGAGLPVSQ